MTNTLLILDNTRTWPIFLTCPRGKAEHLLRVSETGMCRTETHSYTRQSCDYHMRTGISHGLHTKHVQANIYGFTSRVFTSTDISGLQERPTQAHVDITSVFHLVSVDRHCLFCPTVMTLRILGTKMCEISSQQSDQHYRLRRVKGFIGFHHILLISTL